MDRVDVRDRVDVWMQWMQHVCLSVCTFLGRQVGR